MRTFKRGLTVAACLALAACAGRAPPPAINDKVVTVQVPVAVRCIDPARVPAKPAPVTLTGDAKADVAILARKDLLQESWIDQVSTLLPPCEVPAR